jgi:L-fuconolactonase
MGRLMRVDSHQHFWRLSRGDYGWLAKDSFPSIYRDFMPADLAPLLAEARIDRTILVQAAPTKAETHFLLDLAGETAFVAGVVGWTDFDSKDAEAAIARLAQNKNLLGLRPMIQDLEDDAWMLSPAIAPAFRSMVQAGLKFDALVKPRHLGPLARFLDRNPDLPVAIDHGAKPDIARHDFDAWASAMREIAANSGRYVVCKLSGLVTEAGEGWSNATLKPYVDVLLEAFGPQRLMWGSDWPVATLSASYAQWLDAAEALTEHLTERDRSLIFGGTAARFYGIDGASP